MSVETARRGRVVWAFLLLLALVPAAGASGLALPDAARAADGPPRVYVADSGAGEVSQFGLGPGGLLAPLAPPAIAAGAAPEGIALSPDGQSLYVTDHVADVVLQYDVHADGTLSPKAPASVATGHYPAGIAVSADGTSVYVADDNTFGAISEYDVAADGTLSPKAIPTVEAGEYPLGVVASPDGRSLYATDSGSAGQVYRYDVAVDGSLTLRLPTTAAGADPHGIALGPDGRSLYVANLRDDDISQYDVAVDGSLSPKSPPTVAAGESPTDIAVSPDGRSLYVTDGHDAGTVSQYDVAVAGSLSPKSPPTVAAGHFPHGIALTSDGRSAYVADTNSGTVSQYTVTVGGTLVPMSPPTAATDGGPTAIVVGPGPTPPPPRPEPQPQPQPPRQPRPGSPAPAPAPAPAPPAVEITNGPAGEAAATGAVFRFTGVPGGRFECSLDGSRWASCSSGQAYHHLAPGDHLFRVREKLGERTGAPASWRWTVELPRRCVLRVARARVFVFRKKSSARLVIHYTSWRPAGVTVAYALDGRRGKLKLGSATARFRKAGVFRLPERLDRREMVKLRAARRFTVRFEIPKTPHSCGRYYAKRLTIPRRISGQTVWFQADSRFAPARPPGRLVAHRPSGASSSRGTYSSSWERSSNVRLSTSSKAKSS